MIIMDTKQMGVHSEQTNKLKANTQKNYQKIGN